MSLLRRKLVTHYDNLKVASNAPDVVIRAAYRVLVQQNHPDKFPDRAVAEHRIKIINKAYEVLSDPGRRKEHDEWIAAQSAHSARNVAKASVGEPDKNRAGVTAPRNNTIPYDQIFKQAAYGRGVPMWGAKSAKPATAAWPQPFPYNTDLKKAKALLDQTPYKDGFEVPLSYDLGEADWGEPAALLIQESLGKIGIKVTLDKVPGANWRTVALVEKKLPFLLENFGGWLNTPCYYFYWSYLKGNLFNASNYDDATMAKLVEDTLYAEKTDPNYAPRIRQMIQKAFDDLPRIPLWQPTLESAMVTKLQGYQFWFHRQVDARPLKL